MKAIINLRKTTAVAAIAMIALTASAQTGPRSSARNNGSEANESRTVKPLKQSSKPSITDWNHLSIS
jgi:hypothetical protein